MLQRFKQNWTWVRIFKLALGTFIGFQAFEQESWILGVLSAYWLVFAFYHIQLGACQGETCGRPIISKHSKNG